METGKSRGSLITSPFSNIFGEGELTTMESVKAWKDSNTLKTSSKEPVRREYAIYSFDPEEVHDFFIWGGWNEGYEDRFLINSDRF